MALILDTDLLSIIQYESQPAYDRLMAQLASQSDPVVTTIINFEERVQGWMAVLRKATKRQQVLRAYEELVTVLEVFTTMKVLPFDDAAMDNYDELRRQKLRIGTMDLRIASIALATARPKRSRVCFKRGSSPSRR